MTLGYGTGTTSFGGNATAYMTNAAGGVINVVANAHATNGATRRRHRHRLGDGQ